MAPTPDKHVAPAEPPSAEPPLAAPASDRCGNCNAQLAHDQRYCVNCGERRGRLRFGPAAPAGMADGATTSATGTTTGAAAPASTSASPRFSPGTTLVAGVATLLLAMGVGVLIGENGASASSRQAAAGSPQVITVNDGGSGQASTATTATAGSTHAGKAVAGHRRSGATGKGSGTQVVHLTKKVTQEIQKGVSNVVGTSAHLTSPTTQLGGKCQNGQAGCQNGKFTGNFFGSG